MLPKGLIAGLLVVSLLAQGLPISVCRCALGAASRADAAKEVAAEPVCPHCVAKAAEASNDAAQIAKIHGDEVAFAEPCCGKSSSCPCCLEKSQSRTIVTTADVSVSERPVAQALPPTDPFADLSGISIDGVPLGAVPDVPPRLPVRILLCVWRK
jgi:hypothetical protein